MPSDNVLDYGDNLDVMRRYLKDESVDLCYLDPPFNSKQAYNAFFKEKGGDTAASQIKAFEDTWHWIHKDNESFTELQKIVDDQRTPDLTRKLLLAFYDFMGGCDMMAYVMMMAPRLVEVHRVLKPAGSIYLHCDPTASHYLRLILDSIFGAKHFRNEIVWKRKAGRGETNREAIRFGVSTDSILFYGCSDESIFHRQYRKSNPNYIETKFTHSDPDGRRYRLDNLTSPSYRHLLCYEYKGYKPPPKGWAVSLDRMKEMEAQGLLYFPKNKSHRIQRKRYLDKLEGETVDSLWDDIPPINSQAQERMHYPTQKPIALLRRIISASCPAGGVVFDPFCGCGTTVDAAQEMGLQWVGIDITQVAITTIKKRLVDRYDKKGVPVRFLRASDPECTSRDDKAVPGGIVVRVIGEPVTPEDAAKMAKEDEYGFQWWAAGLVGGRGTAKKGPDEGIDGKVLFRDDPQSASGQEIILQVKGGQLKADDVRALGYVVEREKAAIGVLISIEQPTEKMYSDAAKAGYYTHKLNGQKYPRLQLRTVRELMEGKGIERPSSATSMDDTFKKAAKAKSATGETEALPL